MSLTPAYGQTPVSAEDEAALTAWARELLGEPLTKAAVFDLEQGIQVQETREYLVPAVLDGTLALDELLSDRFLRELHERLYGEIWDWAGAFRTRDLNIGVAPWNIGSDLVQSFETIRYRWSLGHWSPRQVGIAAHAESVRVHPFADGNGRTTRLLGDLVFLAAQPATSKSTTGNSTDSTSADTSNCCNSSMCTASPTTWRTTCRCAPSVSDSRQPLSNAAREPHGFRR